MDPASIEGKALDRDLGNPDCITSRVKSTEYSSRHVKVVAEDNDKFRMGCWAEVLMDWKEGTAV